MKLIDLIPINEIEFRNQDSFDAYKKRHKLRPDTEVTIAGKKTTVAAASEKKGLLQKIKSNIFGNDEPPTKMPDLKADNPINRLRIADPKSGREITVKHIVNNPEKFKHLAADVQSIVDTDPDGKKASGIANRSDAFRKKKAEKKRAEKEAWREKMAKLASKKPKTSRSNDGDIKSDDESEDDYDNITNPFNTGSSNFGGYMGTFGGGGSSGGAGATGGW